MTTEVVQQMLHAPNECDDWAIGATHATPIGTLARGYIESVDFVERVIWLSFPRLDKCSRVICFSLDEVGEA